MSEINIIDFIEVKPKVNGFDKESIKITNSGIFFPVELCEKDRVKMLIKESIVLFNFSDDGFKLSPNGKSKSSKKIYLDQNSRLRKDLFGIYKIKTGSYKFEKIEIDEKIYYKIDFALAVTDGMEEKK